MNFSVGITEEHNEVLKKHLIREDGQEDLCFALYNSSNGKSRSTAVIKEIILPNDGDRIVHGNVSFTSQYYDRVSSIALQKGCGICFIHSHPSLGWQSMSSDDILAENMLAPRVKGITGWPLLGMTFSEDFIWSARFWIKDGPKIYNRYYCAQVRVVGKQLQMSYNDKLYPQFVFGDEFIRTISAWGNKQQNNIARLRIGIVGLGSVGSIIAEALIKTGIQNLILIDFDTVERKNLDRLQGIGLNSIGQLKVFAVKNYLKTISINNQTTVEAVPYSIVEEEGIKAALDCDVLFSCVDRPWPRFILNCLSYANIIPIIDGGIEANANKSFTNLDQARWKAHAVGPGRACLCCLGQYKSEEVALEQSGLLEDQHYIKCLPTNHFVNRGENVFAFSIGLAGMEMQQFLTLNLKPRNQYIGPKEYNFNSGVIDSDFPFYCKDNCEFSLMVAEGDKINNSLIAKHSIAEHSRLAALKETSINNVNFSRFQKIKTVIRRIYTKFKKSLP